MRTLWLITARSGSKAIQNKNIKDLNGFPLIAYRIKTALSIADKNDIWISTDSEEYADIAKSYGATVPFIRPSELSTDGASSMDVVLHAMQFAEKLNRHYDFIGLLEPTSPFVYFDDIKNALSKLSNTSEANSIVAVKESRPNTFFIQDDNLYIDQIGERIQQSLSLGRQNFNRQITPSGGFYISKWNSFLKDKTFYTKKTLAYILPDESTLEIDEPIDFDWARFLLDNKKIDTKKLYL